MSVFSLIYPVSLRIQSECGKIQTRKNSVLGHFSRSASVTEAGSGCFSTKVLITSLFKGTRPPITSLVMNFKATFSFPFWIKSENLFETEVMTR